MLSVLLHAPLLYRGLQVGLGTAAELKVTYSNIIDHQSTGYSKLE